MNGFWKFLSSKDNREILAWLGGGAVVVAGGLWAAIVYFYPPGKGEGGGGTKIEASCGSVGIGGNADGATITAGGAAANCPPKPK